jgi:hypothetical protein
MSKLAWSGVFLWPQLAGSEQKSWPTRGCEDTVRLKLILASIPMILQDFLTALCMWSQ